NEERSIIIFESPNRIEKTLRDIREFVGNREVVIIREITKIYEEILRGTTEELIEKLVQKPIKGEIVLLIKGKEEEERVKRNKYPKEEYLAEDEEEYEEFEDGEK
ncbi:MAG: hypothetical protein ACRC4Z_04655, partial [Fusobacteriaceae bacterium]